MAESPAHKFGQIIGDVLEAAIEPLLRDFCKKHRLFLDRKGPRPARGGKKVSWVDRYDNTHDLDFVIERNGSPRKIGTPVAFIETAWRRYTKHSRNKAQEIQGAILPLVATHQHAAPFIGVVLAGEFTDGALSQLRSHGFCVLHFSYETVVSAFKAAGINAAFDEGTPDSKFAAKVSAWESCPDSRRRKVISSLQAAKPKDVKVFVTTLRDVATRIIAAVTILPLHGAPLTVPTVDDAIAAVERYVENSPGKPVVKYEIQIRYNNGDRISAELSTKHAAIEFLRSYQSPPLRPAP